jgi:hypothetical protein
MQLFKVNESVIALLVIFVVTSLSVFASYIEKNSNEKIFQFDSCKRCSGNNCVPEIRFTKFKVTKENIETYYISYGAENKIVHSNKSNEKCEILKDKNFAFTCSSYEKSTDKDTENIYVSSVVFDGINQYQETSARESNTNKLISSLICSVK